MCQNINIPIPSTKLQNINLHCPFYYYFFNKNKIQNSIFPKFSSSHFLRNLKNLTKCQVFFVRKGEKHTYNAFYISSHRICVTYTLKFFSRWCICNPYTPKNISRWAICVK